MKLNKLFIVLPFIFSLTAKCVSIDYESELEFVKKNEKKLYSNKSEVLKNLDKGTLEYYNGNYKDAIKNFSTAEKKIEKYFSKSITQSIGSFVVNDLVIDYPGEDYEDIYLNLFMSLSYYHLGKIEDANVEINRFKNKAQHISSRHEQELIKARQAANNKSADFISVAFHNSALGQYLALLYHRELKEYDAMYADSRALHDAFITQKSLYNFAEPTFIQDELSVPKGFARINLLAFSNSSPVKIETTVPLPIITNGIIPYITIPVMKTQFPKVNYVRVKAKNNVTGKTYSCDLEQIESLDNIALEAFKLRSDIIFNKAFARRIVKDTSNAVGYEVGKEMSKSSDPAISLIGVLLRFFSSVNNILTYTTEQADTRVSKYFPARADAGGITVEPGEYTVAIEFYRTKGGELLCRKSFKNINAKENKLTLLDASYLDEAGFRFGRRL